jgi:hypothetical protein
MEDECRLPPESGMYQRVRELLRTQQLNSVEYDRTKGVVTRVNHEDCVDVDELACAPE